MNITQADFERLPMRRVEIEPSGFGDYETAAWLERFDLYFQKGGG